MTPKGDLLTVGPTEALLSGLEMGLLSDSDDRQGDWVWNRTWASFITWIGYSAFRTHSEFSRRDVGYPCFCSPVNLELKFTQRERIEGRVGAEKEERARGEREGGSSSSWILTSCQPQRGTSGLTNSSHITHKQIHVSKLFSHVIYQPSVKSVYKTN